MEDNVDINKIPESCDDSEEFEFKYNFINTPWDDRSNKSKAGIVALLIAIFTATMACVANNFAMHYRGFKSSKSMNHSEMNCIKVKIEEYPYVANIYSVSSKELLCVGVVVSPTSILANGVCVKSGPIRVHVGSAKDPYCKKGFTVDVIEPVSHDSVTSLKKLVLLSSYENMKQCTHHVVRIGTSLDWKSMVHIIGRPLGIGRPLTRQVVALARKEFMASGAMKNLNFNNMICVKDLARCPVRVGDLLVQNGCVFGLAATNVYSLGRNKVACFVSLDVFRSLLMEMDSAINA
ncbi:Uncharacterized protein OBRU01_22603 [Operophtera brumata]|uniref:Peptidase S1 domain-containing protein n=1 Tax=Operophtera brumata TaxID=104452 RepID=A0A0L7KQ90_OPEBR|nr:Uncharacterized protein OBRU01_22603 [Operophtera brumata]